MAAPHAVFHPLRVSRIEELTEDSVAITFDVPEDLRDDYAFVAGQHLSIRGGDDVRRSYSLCTPPSSGVLRIGVKRLPGGAFSEEVVDRLTPTTEEGKGARSLPAVVQRAVQSRLRRRKQPQAES